MFAAVPLGADARQPLTLEVPARETVAVLGDENSGVGDLGGYALGLERPAAGRVLVFDTVIADLPERERLAFRRRVGYLPAGDALLQNLSLRNNIALPVRFGSDASTREIEGRVNVMLAAVRLTARTAAELLEFARGGETAEGARRTVLITGQELPAVLHRRIERVYRLTRAGTLQLEPA